MRFYSRPLNLVWLKAAALGSFWGAIEIILGSYLHNLHVPLAGTFLTFLVIVFLTIFSGFWDESGIAIRASIIAALIKSISPSAVLLGPMTAIILEGFLFEVGITVLGKNLAGYILAGILVQLSVIFHKIISLLIIYSTDIIKIAENFYNFLTKLLYLENLPPYKALIFVFVLYTALGIIAAVAGYYAGKKLQKKYSSPDNTSFKFSYKAPFKISNSRSEPIRMLLNVVITGLLLWAISRFNIYLVTFLVVAYIVTGYVLYPQAFRIFKKPGFWIQLFIFWILAVLFYNELNKLQISKESVIIGLRLVLRALIIISFFSTLSVQIRAPLIKSFLLRRGLNNLYLTLKLAVSILPQFLEYLSNTKASFKILRQLIFFTLNLVKFFELTITHRRVFIVEGDKNEGKTSFMDNLQQQFEKLGISIGGIITIKKIEGQKFEYYVKNIEDGREVLLCTNQKINDYYYKTHHFYFTHEGVRYGSQILSLNANKPILFVDEVGVLELRGLGWANTLETLLSINKNMVWAVRRRYTNQVLWKFFINEAIIFDVKTDDYREAAITITKKLFEVNGQKN